jgi:hypothetical protein
VRWQFGRWDTDPRRVYVANVCDATAYDVKVTVHDCVISTAVGVPPFDANLLDT